MEVDDPGHVKTSIKKMDSEELKGVVGSLKERLKEEQNEISGKKFFWLIFRFIAFVFFLMVILVLFWLSFCFW